MADLSSSYIEENSNRNVSMQSENTSFIAESVTLGEASSLVVMAVECKNSRVGCAIYHKDGKKMSCYLDTNFKSPDVTDEFSAVFKQWNDLIKPTVLLVSTSFPVEFESVITDKNDATDYKIEYRPSHEFSTALAVKNLSRAFSKNAKVFQPDYEQAVAHSKFWIRQLNPDSSDLELNPFSESFFDKENHLSACCISAIFSYLSSEEDIELDRCIRAFTIDAIEETMVVSSDTINALRLFQEESHPNLHYTKSKQNGSSACVFNILNQTCSQLGAGMLKEWVFRPSTNIDLIQSRHNLISIFLLPENDDIVKEMRKSLRKIKNIPRVLRDIDVVSLPLADWTTLANFLEEFKALMGLADRTDGLENTPLYRSMKDTLSRETTHQILTQIISVINLEKSALTSQIEIQTGINSKLDELKLNYDNMDSILDSVTKELEEKVQLFGVFNVSYIAQIGFVIAVDIRNSNVVNEMIMRDNDDEWSLIFSTVTTHYYKSISMQYMNQSLGDVYGVIADLTIEITQKLQSLISPFIAILLKACDVVAQLDCHLALAWAARQNGYNRPEMTSGRNIIIQDGYHPLYEKLVDSFIPNSLSLAYEDEDSNTESQNIILVTGANFSGKTVYLTQNAVIVIMAQIGSFVPAKNATIGIVDRILTRVATRESVSKTKSSFLNDLEQVSSMFRLMTPRSLLVIDEFGKGTDTKDGAALFGSMIQHFQNLGDKCPKVLASTHFHELMEQNIIRVERGLKTCHMEIYVNDSAGGEISYLYKVQPGKASSSFGICCAKLCGIDPSIINLAEKIYEEKLKGGNFTTFFLNCSPEEEKKMRIASRIVRKFLEEDLDSKKGLQNYLTRLLRGT